MKINKLLYPLPIFIAYPLHKESFNFMDQQTEPEFLRTADIGSRELIPCENKLSRGIVSRD
jgi:hypothetical protein